MKLEQCCDEPRGFVGGVCDHCGGEVQSEFTNLELQQQVSKWRSRAYKLETSRDKWKACAVEFDNDLIAAYSSFRKIEELMTSDLTDEECLRLIAEIIQKHEL